MDNTAAQLNQFLMDVERKAFAMAKLSLGNADDALDVVQDSMMKLAKRYAKRSPTEWRPLFFRILKNAIRDHYRRRASFTKRFTLMSGLFRKDEEVSDVTEWHPGRETDQPEVRQQLDSVTAQAEAAVSGLPDRQREAFLLRSWEGLSVAETAKAMACSEGSVKTHHSRAVHRLREVLGEHWP
ncbi:MAG: RNA polymerase sigma factor [Pseudomonadota bacterium]